MIIVYTSGGHQEIAEALKYEINQLLEYEPEVVQKEEFLSRIKQDYQHKNDLHIFLDIHHFTDDAIGFQLDKYIPNYIAYNLVIILKKLKPKSYGNIVRLYKNAKEVWDYAMFNYHTFLYTMNITPKWVPFSYSKCNDLPRTEVNKDIDILFFGTLTPPRRKNLLDSMKNKGWKVHCVDNVYDRAEKVKLITRAKILLDVCQTEFYTFSANRARLCFYLANGGFVVSERSGDKIYTKDYKNHVIFSDYEDMIDVCQRYLDNSSEREDFAKKSYLSYKTNCKYSDVIPVNSLRPYIPIKIQKPETTLIRKDTELNWIDLISDLNRQTKGSTLDAYPYIHSTYKMIPDHLYQQMINSFPSDEIFEEYDCKKPGNAEGTSENKYPLRRSILLGHTNDCKFPLEKLSKSWQFFTVWMLSTETLDLMKNKYYDFFRIKDANYKIKMYINVDQPDYEIGPHTDSSGKMMTGLIYFVDPQIKEETGYQKSGTSLFVDRQNRPWRTDHYKLENDGFDCVKTVDYTDNTCFEFITSEKSYHGVYPTKARKRYTVQYCILSDRKN